MKSRINLVSLSIIAAILFAVMVFPTGANASHWWGGYHWARTANPFTLKVVDSNTPDWDDNKARSISEWSTSTVLDLLNVAGDDLQRTRKRCPMVSGQIRSCNASYGFNGWLGLASINITGGTHITQGSAKMNDSYFNGGGYTETNRQQVMCQEIGHTFGLDHQDTSGADLNTCMDYANALDNPSPNAHDYDELLIMYSHLDSTTTIGFASSGSNAFGDENAPENWGRLVSQSANGRSTTYERENWDGTKLATHVFWTIQAAEVCRGCDHRYDH
ncbi:MAG: hypothetical protein ABIP78_09755 [Pyrinomonadaceae bacterium]